MSDAEVRDDQLLRRLVDGGVEDSEEAFGCLFERHAELVYGVAFRRTGSTAAAEDILAEVFLDLWRRRGQVRLRSRSLRPWLAGAASNQARRFWRSDRRRGHALERVRSSPEAHGVESHPGEEIPDRVVREARARAVLDALDVLPVGQRDVLTLWVWEELSYEEIAEALDIPVGTVRSRLARARGRLNGVGLPDGLGTVSTHPGSGRSPNRAHRGARR